MDAEKEILALVSSSVHDMKTPLTTIGGFIELVLDGTAKGDEARHCLETALSEVKRLRGIAEELLDVSKLCAGNFEPKRHMENICEIVSGAVVALSPKLNEKDLHVNTNFSDEQIMLNVDGELIYRAVYDILENAIKFSPVKGSIDIAAEKTDHGIKLSIMNEGSSISENELEHVFDPFYQSEAGRSHGGTGLGLFIVSKAATAHGGRAWAESGKLTDDLHDDTEFCRINFEIGNGDKNEF